MLYNTNHHNEINVRHLPEPLAGCGVDCGNTEAALPIVGTDGTPNCIFALVSIVRFHLTLPECWCPNALMVEAGTLGYLQ